MSIAMLSGGAANGLVNRVRDGFRARTGLEIEGDFGAVGGMRDRILAGENVDVVILTRAILEQLAESGHVRPDSLVDLGQVVTGIGVRDGDTIPDISTGDALRATLLAADAIYTPDTVKATAGIHVASVLERLGISEQTASALRLYPNGQTAMATMASGADANPIGCTQVTEILNTAGVTYVGALPDPYGLATTYTAGVSTGSRLIDSSMALIEVLSAAETAADRISSGFS